MIPPRLLSVLLVAGFVLGPVAACSGASGSRRYKRGRIQKRLERLETPGLVLGTFQLASDPVLDGDTILVSGLETSLRLLAIDTEETFKKDEDRRLAEADFDAYLQAKRGDSPRPVKAATPLGEEAKRFAREFFEDVDEVRLERDHPKQIRGRYGRYLVYVFARKGGEWVNYNLACVRAGMSPYFTKYNYSRRFHQAFVRAQQQARKDRLGIWSPGGAHYRDYDERIAWWNARAAFIQKFEQEAASRDDMVSLGDWDALRRLEGLLGKQAEVLGTVGEIILGDRGPTRVMLSRREHSDFPLIFFDKDVFGSSGISRFDGEYIRARGTISKYRHRRSGRTELQMVIELPSQVTGSIPRPAAIAPGVDEDAGGAP